MRLGGERTGSGGGEGDRGKNLQVGPLSPMSNWRERDRRIKRKREGKRERERERVGVSE